MSKINLTQYDNSPVFFLTTRPDNPTHNGIFIEKKDEKFKVTFPYRYSSLSFFLTSKQVEKFPELKRFPKKEYANTDYPKLAAFIQEECSCENLTYEFKKLMKDAGENFQSAKAGHGTQMWELTPYEDLPESPWRNYLDILEEIDRNLASPFNKRQTETLLRILSQWLQSLPRSDWYIDLNLLNIILSKIKTLVSQQEFAKIVVENINIAHLLNSHSTYKNRNYKDLREDSKSLHKQQLNLFKTLPAELLKHFSLKQLQSLFTLDLKNVRYKVYPLEDLPFLKLTDEMRRLVKEKISNDSGSLLTHFPNNGQIYEYFDRIEFKEHRSLRYNAIIHRKECFEFLKKLSKQKKDDASPDRDLAQLAGQYIELEECFMKTRNIGHEYKGTNSVKIGLINSILDSLKALYLDLSKGKPIDMSVVYEKIIDVRKQLKKLHGSWTGMSRSKMEKLFDKDYGQLFMRYELNYQGKSEDNILNSFVNGQVTIKKRKTPLESKPMDEKALSPAAMYPVLENSVEYKLQPEQATDQSTLPPYNPDPEGLIKTYSPHIAENPAATAPPPSLYPLLDVSDSQTVAVAPPPVYNPEVEGLIQADSSGLVTLKAPPSLYPELEVTRPPAYNPAFISGEEDVLISLTAYSPETPAPEMKSAVSLPAPDSEETLTVPAEECSTEILTRVCDNILLDLFREAQKSPGTNVETRLKEIFAAVKDPRLSALLKDRIDNWMAFRKEKASPQLEQKTTISPVLKKQPISESEPPLSEPDSEKTPDQKEKTPSSEKSKFEKSVSALINSKTPKEGGQKKKKKNQQNQDNRNMAEICLG